MDLSINIISEEDKSVVHLIGEIDVYTASKLKESLLPLTERPMQMIEVNFERVEYMDSTGLGVFISALKSSKRYGSHIKLINLNEREHRLFKITGLNKIIDIDSIDGVNSSHGTF